MSVWAAQGCRCDPLPGSLPRSQCAHATGWVRCTLGLRILPPFLLPFQLAVQLGLTIARCARVDYPAEWPGLLAELWALVEGDHLGIQGARILARCAESETHGNHPLFQTGCTVTHRPLQVGGRSWCFIT